MPCVAQTGARTEPAQLGILHYSINVVQVVVVPVLSLNLVSVPSCPSPLASCFFAVALAQLPPAADASQLGRPSMPPSLPPPLPSGGHPPAPPPLPPAQGGSGPSDDPSVRGALLASITDGKKLKKMERPAPDTTGGGGGGGNELLEAIRYVEM